jgi:hypothetical protein
LTWREKSIRSRGSIFIEIVANVTARIVVSGGVFRTGGGAQFKKAGCKQAGCRRVSSE